MSNDTPPPQSPDFSVSPPTGHRDGVGGLWDQIGNLQFEFLVKQGLRPEHRLLDIGCGALRGGVRFMRYLKVGHYYGIDKEPSLLKAAAEIEAPQFGVGDRQPQLLLTDCFDLSGFSGVQFDYMLAQSVFTHLTPQLIELCLKNVMPSLKLEGTFFATFFESPDGRSDPGSPHPWRKGEMRRSTYPFSEFVLLADRLNIQANYVGNWNHPRGQHMLAFRHHAN